MKIKKLSEQQKEKLTGLLVILLGVAVLAGQVAETQSGFLRDVSHMLRMYIDTIQYMIAMFILNFIFVITAIKKYEHYPNPFLDTLKWYFAILMISDFFVMVFRIIQQNNLIPLRSGLVVGLGQTYLMLASMRGIIELTFTSAAALLFVYGLMRYAPILKASPENTTARTILGLIIFHWLTAIPVNISSFIGSRGVYAWSLGLSQAAQIGIALLIYWVIKEYHQHYRTKFFAYLNMYYGLNLLMQCLIFTYSMGSFGIMQRYPVGEIELMGSFGQIVFYLTRLAFIPMNYFMYRAIASYREP
ncbi:hypothetical protein [Phosphitispora sp. TUW77]|uniref:hypothetical protein n=1 Tax=Phosphitispora sp. TUW77 TaxID=3152361 RepID=UPI003AB4AC86